jgi:hypothetical protein
VQQGVVAVVATVRKKEGWREVLWGIPELQRFKNEEERREEGDKG